MQHAPVLLLLPLFDTRFETIVPGSFQVSLSAPPPSSHPRAMSPHAPSALKALLDPPPFHYQFDRLPLRDVLPLAAVGALTAAAAGGRQSVAPPPPPPP